jgi:predicted ribosome quality control (RQC) complex YloA/Tae2 family protein
VYRAEIERVVDELRGLEGAFVTGTWQPSRDRVFLGLEESFLLIVPRGPFARIHQLKRRPASPPTPFSFQGACRARLRGRLREVLLDPADRVVDLIFDSARLHLRLVGVRGGLWLVDGETIVAAYDGPAPERLPSLPHVPGLPQRAPRFEPLPNQTFNEAADRWFSTAEQRGRRQEQITLVRRRLKTQLDKDNRLLQALHADLTKASTVDESRRIADALAASLHQVPRRATQAIVTDLEDPSVAWTISLDPSLSPGGNLQRLYQRVRRLARMGDHVLEHIERVEHRIQRLHGALAVLDDADDATFAQIQDLTPAPRDAARATTQTPWFVWRATTGDLVLVGKNASSNRKLTFQRARGHDWWMHLRSRPGAHLLLPMAKGQVPSLEHLLAAAQIAGLHAKIPEGMGYEVQYTRANRVRSIKGAPDGRVTVHDEKVLNVVRDIGAPAGWQREDVADPHSEDVVERLIIGASRPKG